MRVMVAKSCHPERHNSCCDAKDLSISFGRPITSGPYGSLVAKRRSLP